MKIQLASDLHLEYLQRNFPLERLIAPAYGADVLVLAGDIANGTLAIELAGRIVGESLDDDERSTRVVDRFLADLESMETAAAAGRDGDS